MSLPAVSPFCSPKKVKPKREPENPTRSFLLFTLACPSNSRKNSWFAHFPGSPRSWLVLSVSDGKFKLRFLNIVIIVYQKFYLLIKFNKMMKQTHSKLLTHTCHAGSKPEMVRTAGCSALVRVGFVQKEHPEVGISGLLSLLSFFGEAKKERPPAGEVYSLLSR